jgi:hypothetical protein
MPLSMYQASVPVFARLLRNLHGILEKAQAHALARGIDPQVLAASRLYPDMFPLTRQVQIACDSARLAVARLAGITAPSIPDTETTLPELVIRVDQTVAFINTMVATQIDDSENREIVLNLPSGRVTLSGLDYLRFHALPNCYFHVTTTYNILRHNGVELGKRDFLG